MSSIYVLNFSDFWPIIPPSFKRSKRNGQIALPFILLVSGIIIEIAIAGSFVAYYLSASGLGVRLSLRAETAAKAGIDDAIVQIAQNKEYGASDVNYTLTVDSDSVAVAVSRTVNSAANIYLYTITATATAGQKKFVATVTVNQTTGQVQLQSEVETSVN